LNTGYIQLGKTGIKITPMGIGIMQWSDLPMPENNDPGVDQKIREIYTTTIAAGINLFDTAEMYGRGRSEIHLGRCLEQIDRQVVVATKFMPFPWRLSKWQFRTALLHSLQRLSLGQVDLYQMHWPFPPVPIKNWMDAMADAFADGLIKAVGVSNYSCAQTRLAFDSLARYKIPLASNQVKYSLLDRRPEQSGLVDLCNELGITIIAYSPLEKGILTAQYSVDNLPSGFRAWRYNKAYLTKIKPLMDVLAEIGKTHSDKTPAQVALNWLICKGAVPIPGARNQKQAVENAGGSGWHLSDEEIARLDNISRLVTQVA
jgi:aryl-alcohol dehydrogenase-like predicted oxidoreductase